MACWMGLFFDFLCFIAVGLPIILFKVVGEPYHRGFYCTDQSIGKPYKEGTVHSNVLYSVGFGLTCLVMIFTELWFFKRKSKEEKVTNTVHLRLGRLALKLNSLVVCLLELIAVFAFGAAVNILVTDVGKYTIGRLRPHFLSVCEPDPAVVWNCTATTYITGEVCTGDPVLVHKARLSFPSGHSSFSAYTMTVLVLYIEARMHFQDSRFLKMFLQLLAALLAILCSLSRVSDYKHHWSDVLAGMILGILVAVIVVSKMLDWFRKLNATRQTRVVETAHTKSMENVV